MTKGSDIQDLANVLRGEGFSKEADKLVSQLEKGEKLSRSLEKQLQAIAKKNSADLTKKMKTIKEMEKDLHLLNEEQKNNLKLLKESAKEQEKQNKAISNYAVASNTATKSVKSFSEMQSQTATRVRSASEAIQRHTSVLGLLDAALIGIEAVYESWFAQQRDWTRSMGEFAMRTGATARQLQDARNSGEALRGTMASLGGSLTGINEAMQLVGDASLAMRMNIGSMSEELQMDILGTMRGLGVGASEAALLARTLESGIEGGNESLGEFTINIREFAESIGANASTISRDFLDARNTLATFGEDGGEVFRRTATFANTLGFETRRVLDMFRRFDTFGAASDNVNQLNAMFGTTISSFELMSEEDPIRRIQMITDAIQSQGMEWDNMSRQQRMALAGSLGVSEDEAARLMNGENMASINAENEERQRREATMAGREAAARETILGIIERTSTAFRSISDYVQMIIDDVAHYLSPIFNAMRDNSTSIMESIREWVRSIMGNQEFQQIVHNIADWIAEMPTHINEFMPTWEEVRDTAIEMWPMIRSIGEMIMSVIGFAVDHPEAMEVAMGALVISNLVGGFGQIALLLSPGGAILAGVAALGMGMMQATTHADRMAASVREISAIAAGDRTASERETLTRNREGALTDLALTSSGPSGASRAWAGLGNVAGDVAGFFGATDVEATIEESASTGTFSNMRANIERALASEASVRDVTASLIAAASNDEAGVRDALGLTRSEPLDSGIYNAVSAINSEVNPMVPAALSTGGSAAAAPISALESAPVTGTTAATPPTSATVGETTIVASNVLLDGRNVGRAFFEISRA